MLAPSTLPIAVDIPRAVPEPPSGRDPRKLSQGSVGICRNGSLSSRHVPPTSGVRPGRYTAYSQCSGYGAVDCPMEQSGQMC
jgi:hypothetical protein